MSILRFRSAWPVSSVPTLLSVAVGGALSAVLFWPTTGPQRSLLSTVQASTPATVQASTPATVQASAPAVARAGSAELAPPVAAEGLRHAGPAAVGAPDGRSATWVNCSVVQRGTPTNHLWWFGGADAQNYSERVTLTVRNGRFRVAPPLRWTVLVGKEKVDFENGRDSMITAGRQVDLVSTGPSVAATEPVRDVQIRVTDANGLSCRYETLVLAPDHLVATGQLDLPGPEGFFTEINYRSEDQFNRTLPFIVEVNQDFGPEVSDFAGENWSSPEETGTHVFPFLWTETIERCGPTYSTPPVLTPQSPLTTVKVDHRDGVLRHGSTTTNPGADNNPGVAVRSLTWQVYQDHGRHE